MCPLQRLSSLLALAFFAAGYASAGGWLLLPKVEMNSWGSKRPRDLDRFSNGGSKGDRTGLVCIWVACRSSAAWDGTEVASPDSSNRQTGQPPGRCAESAPPCSLAMGRGEGRQAGLLAPFRANPATVRWMFGGHRESVVSGLVGDYGPRNWADGAGSNHIASIIRCCPEHIVETID